MNLKTKARIYRYTGIYLAMSEESAYVKSDTTQMRAKKLANEYGENIEVAIGVEIGMWQAMYGFYRPMSVLRFQRPYFATNFVASIHESFLAIKNDFKLLLRHFKQSKNKSSTNLKPQGNSNAHNSK